MIVENQGMIYRLGLDIEAIQKIAYSLIVVGEQEVAFQVLVNTFCNEEQATALIDDVLKKLSTEETN